MLKLFAIWIIMDYLIKFVAMFPVRGKINRYSVNFKPDFDCKRSEYYVPSPVVSVRFTELPNGGVVYNSDVKLLFNQQRLEKILGSDTVNAFLNGLDQRYKSSIRQSVDAPDSVILDFVKSRNIQAPCELLAWSKYLNEQAQSLEDAAAASAVQDAASSVSDNGSVDDNNASISE